jgi:hypothetical protein
VTGRGLVRSVIRRIVPPLPAVSRPSNTTMILAPDAATHSCIATSSPWSRRISTSYSFVFILGRAALAASNSSMPDGGTKPSVGTDADADRSFPSFDLPFLPCSACGRACPCGRACSSVVSSLRGGLRTSGSASDEPGRGLRPDTGGPTDAALRPTVSPHPSPAPGAKVPSPARHRGTKAASAASAAWPRRTLRRWRRAYAAARSDDDATGARPTSGTRHPTS